MTKTTVEVVAYNPDWPTIYKTERDLLFATTSEFVVIESAALPFLANVQSPL